MKGTHGTTQDRVASIKKNSFQFSWSGASGRRKGSGVYFWDYQTDDYRQDAIELAQVFWANLERIKGKESHPDNKLAIADATFDDDMVLLDGLLKENLEILMVMLRENQSKYQSVQGSNINHDEWGGVYDNFIREVEKAWNKKIHALRISLQVHGKAPARFKMQPQSCLVVKAPEVIKEFEFLDVGNL